VFFFWLFCLHLKLVGIAIQPQIGLEAIGPHLAAGLNRRSDKAMQDRLRKIRDRLQPDAADSSTVPRTDTSLDFEIFRDLNPLVQTGDKDPKPSLQHLPCHNRSGFALERQMLQKMATQRPPFSADLRLGVFSRPKVLTPPAWS
jgi:hypothetical protein